MNVSRRFFRLRFALSLSAILPASIAVAGPRTSEVEGLKVGDIHSQRITLRVERGKGQKDRYAMLPLLTV